MLSFHIVLIVAFFAQAAHGSVTCKDGQMISRGLSASDKQKILDHHNYLRNQVATGKVATQPQAENMYELKWSNELSKKAQTWANGCVFEHNSETYNSKPVGQNLFMGLGVNIKDRSNFYPAEDMVDSWFNEVYQFGYDGNFKSESGHYSQVIWGKTHLVGCGVAQYKSNKDSYFRKYLVCNYSPAGNFIGKKPYAYGSPNCKAHGLKDSSKYDGLCV